MLGLLLDVTGCAHLFGQDEAGERALLADLVERLSRHDLTCRAAMADTAGAAWALARFAERQADLFCPRHGQRAALAALPVEGLRLEAPDPGDLPEAGAAPHRRSLSPAARAAGAALRRSAAHPARPGAGHASPSPSSRAGPPPAFRTRLAFAEPIGRSEDIAAGTSRLLAALCRQFEQAGVGARKLEIALYRVDGSVDRTAIGTSRPNRDNPKLMKLFEEKLGELDPGFGVELVILAGARGRGMDRHADARCPNTGALRRLARPRTARSTSPTGWRSGWARTTSCASCRATATSPSACRRRPPISGPRGPGRRLGAPRGAQGPAADAAPAAARAGR